MKGPTIRPVTLADAGPLAELHIASWRWAYPGIVPQGVLDALDPAKRAAEYPAWWAESRAKGRFDLLAEEAGELLGFAAGGPHRAWVGVQAPPSARAEDGAGGTSLPLAGEGLARGQSFEGELYAVYLEERALGRGLGRALVREAFKGLHERGFRNAAVWVLEKNLRARGFYERLGARLLPLRKTITIGIPLDEVAYGWDTLELA